jgi:hypothetical protein
VVAGNWKILTEKGLMYIINNDADPANVKAAINEIKRRAAPDVTPSPLPQASALWQRPNHKPAEDND